MIFNLAGGGGSEGPLNAYAVISVTYPSGSTCKCTATGISYTAPDTTGNALFGVPGNATYTITCTDGTKTKSTTVSITAKYQVKSVTLSYSYPLYTDGTKNVPWTLENNCTDAASYISLDGSISFIRTTNKIDLTGYSNLVVQHARTDTYNASKHEIGYDSAVQPVYEDLENSKMVTNPASTSKTTTTLDISSISGSRYIYVRAEYGSGSGTFVLRTYQVYLT